MERRTLIIAFVVCGLFLVTLVAILISISTSERQDDFVLPDKLEASQCPRDDFDPPPLILISLDGFHPKYLKRGVTPTINKMIKKGASTPFMAPSFPSVTFPNHYTIVTGLYPESHGIISNSFYDPDFKAKFSYSNNESKKGRWWGGEPIWNTIRKQNLSSATYFWPGSEAPIQGHHPTYFKPYNKKVPLNKRAQQVVEWLELPRSERPSFISLYSHEPDTAGHGHGPYSNQVNTQLSRVDAMVKNLLKALIDRDLLACVNILLISDHGMAATEEEKVIHLDELIPKELQDDIFFSSGAFGRITIRNRDQNKSQLLEESLECKRKEFQLFRTEELPKRFHYSNNKRIGDYVILLRNGYTVNLNSNFYLKGVHGYDNHLPSMHALFVAYGRAFKENYVIKPFQNIQLYNLMCELLGVTPAANNGTQGLLNGILKNPPRISHQNLGLDYEEGKKATLEANWKLNMADPQCEEEEQILEVTARYLNQSYEDILKVERQILPWGTPQSNASLDHRIRVLYHPHFISGYSTSIRLPLWTAFSVDKLPNEPDVGLGPLKLISDPRLEANLSPPCHAGSEENLSVSPLFRPEFARNASLRALSNLNTNQALFSQQLKDNWNDLMTKLVPKWFNESQSLLNIIVGPIFDHDGDGLVDDHSFLKSKDQIIPTDYFAIVTKCSSNLDNLGICPANQLHSLAFIYPQHLTVKMCDVNEFEFAMLFSAKIREIQKLTGLRFFSKLGQRRRLEILSNEYYNLW